MCEVRTQRWTSPWMCEYCRLRKNHTRQILYDDDLWAWVMTQDRDLRVITIFYSWRLLPQVCGDKSYYKSVNHQRGCANDTETSVAVQVLLYMLFCLVLKTILRNNFLMHWPLREVGLSKWLTLALKHSLLQLALDAVCKENGSKKCSEMDFSNKDWVIRRKK